MSEFNQQPISGPSAIAVAAPIAPMQPTTGTPDKRREVLRAVSELFQKSPDWVTFYREVMGVEGIIRRLYPSPEEMIAFEQSEEYGKIQSMLAKLRERKQNDSNEPTRVITVRLPKSLHESLRTEAHERRTSMNQLCISKLLQIIDQELVPSD